MNDKQNKIKIKTSNKEEFLRRFDALPEDLKTAFISKEVTNGVVAVGKKHGLQIDKIGILGDETGLVMLGEIKPNEFIGKLAEELGVEKEKAREIAEDINEQVFRPVRESLKKVHGLAPSAPEKPVAGGEIKIKTEEKPPRLIEAEPFAKKITIPVPPPNLLPANQAGEIYKEGKVEIKQSSPVPKKIIKFSQPPVNLPIEPTPDNLDANSLKSDIEKTLGGEIRSQSQPAKKYTNNDPYREPIGP